MQPHFNATRRLFGMLDSDLVGLPPAFAVRVFLRRRGWTTHQATRVSGPSIVAMAERDGRRIRCEADESATAWWQVLTTAIREHDASRSTGA